jgi:hypothetical protein
MVSNLRLALLLLLEPRRLVDLGCQAVIDRMEILRRSIAIGSARVKLDAPAWAGCLADFEQSPSIYGGLRVRIVVKRGGGL